MRSSSRLLFGLLLGSYLALSLVFWAGQPAQENFDSYRYLGDWGWSLPEIFEPLNGGFATSLLYVALPDASAISLSQVILSAGAWAFLAFAVMRRLSPSWAAWVLAIGLLLLSWHSVFWSSHFAIASESLVFSAVVAWLGAVVFLAGSSSPGRLALTLLILTLVGVAVTRPQAMLLLIPAQVVVLIWWNRREHQSRGLWIGLAALLPTAAWSAFRVFQVSQHDRWPFRYALHNLVEKEPSFRAYALERMPQCDAVTAALAGPQPWDDVLALDNSMINVCPETYVWFQSSATSVFTWVREIPIETLANFIAVVPNIALVRWTEDRVLPDAIDQALMPRLNPWIFLIACFVVGSLLAIAAHVRPRVTPLAVFGTLIVILSVLGYVFAVWAADGRDLGRHVYPLLPLAGIAALTMPSVIPQRRTSVTTPA